jgi:hypothetical protein
MRYLMMKLKVVETNLALLEMSLMMKAQAMMKSIKLKVLKSRELLLVMLLLVVEKLVMLWREMLLVMLLLVVEKLVMLWREMLLVMLLLVVEKLEQLEEVVVEEKDRKYPLDWNMNFVHFVLLQRIFCLMLM